MNAEQSETGSELERKLAEAEAQLAAGAKPIPIDEAMEAWRKILHSKSKREC